MKKLSRRAALTALGAGAALCHLGGTAKGQDQAAGARYFIGVFLPHGMAREYWLPRKDADNSFNITYQDCSLAPFANVEGTSYADRLVVVEGLDLASGMEGGSTGHDGSRAILTGSSQAGHNASLDQYLALERGLGQDTPLSSLVLGVGNGAPDLGQCISYAKGGVALPKIIDPSQTFAQAFAQFVVGDDPAALAQQERERRMGKSLLDYWNQELTRLSARSPAQERDKLDQHATALRELERRLSSSLGDCKLPQVPDPTSYPLLRSYGGGEPYFDHVTDLQIEMLTHALSCGVTRVATLFLADLSRTHLDPTLPDDIHIDVAHKYSSGGRKGGGDAASWLPLAKQNRYTYSKVALLVQRLDKLGILEQSVIIALGDMGNPNMHTSRQVPALLSGGWGGKLQGGWHLDLGAAGTPHNQLLVAAQNAFGIDSNVFGETKDPALAQGALDLKKPSAI